MNCPPMHVVPIFSQGQSLRMLARGDKEGAWQVWSNFLLHHPISSQIISLLTLPTSTALALAIQRQEFLAWDNLVIQGAWVLSVFWGGGWLANGVVHALGFTPDGLTPHSVATDWMAPGYRGDIPKDSLFSHLQQAGRKGVPFGWVVLVAVFLGLTVCGVLAWALAFAARVRGNLSKFPSASTLHLSSSYSPLPTGPQGFGISGGGSGGGGNSGYTHESDERWRNGEGDGLLYIPELD